MQSAEMIQAPRRALAMTEPLRGLWDLFTLPWAAPLLSTAPRGDGHPVLVLPGFLANDRSTWVLRQFLRGLGYETHGWGLGRNLGERTVGKDGERLLARLNEIHERSGRTVSLIGWSLGGFMVRMVAREVPDSVRQIITMGTAFAGNPQATAAWVPKLYQALTGASADDEHVRHHLAISATPPPVPSTAIFSRNDGVTAWQNCLEPESATTDNIEVYGSHSGLGVAPAALYAIADRLALPEGSWTPFDRSGWRRFVYPSAGHGPR